VLELNYSQIRTRFTFIRLYDELEFR